MGVDVLVDEAGGLRGSGAVDAIEARLVDDGHVEASGANKHTHYVASRGTRRAAKRLEAVDPIRRLSPIYKSGTTGPFLESRIGLPVTPMAFARHWDGQRPPRACVPVTQDACLPAWPV
jgi:hypothetical protein